MIWTGGEAAQTVVSEEHRLAGWANGYQASWIVPSGLELGRWCLTARGDPLRQPWRPRRDDSAGMRECLGADA